MRPDNRYSRRTAIPGPRAALEAPCPTLWLPYLPEVLWCAVWIVCFTLVALLAAAPTGHQINHVAGLWAAHLIGPHRIRLESVWVAGAPLVAPGVFLLLTAQVGLGWRDRLLGWGLLLGTALVEAVLKHFGVGGWLSAAPVSAIPHPNGHIHVVQHVINVVVLRFGVHGTFPSGHVLRLTLAGGYAIPAPGWLLPGLVAVGALFAVVATGGHSLTDAVGGATLALGGLALAGRL